MCRVPRSSAEVSRPSWEGGLSVDTWKASLPQHPTTLPKACGCSGFYSVQLISQRFQGMLESKGHAQLNGTEKVPGKAEDGARVSESTAQEFRAATASPLRAPAVGSVCRRRGLWERIEMKWGAWDQDREGGQPEDSPLGNWKARRSPPRPNQTKGEQVQNIYAIYDRVGRP